jgi:hypothetical protein
VDVGHDDDKHRGLGLGIQIEWGLRGILIDWISEMRVLLAAVLGVGESG